MSEDNLSKELKKAIGQLLEQAREEFRRLESNKKETLLKLAQDMENTGYPIDMISETILKAYAGESGLSKTTIEGILPKKYKRKYEKKLNCSEPEHIDEKKPIEVTTTGSVTTETVDNHAQTSVDIPVTNVKPNDDDKELEVDKLKEKIEYLEKQVKEGAIALNTVNTIKKDKDKKIEQTTEFQEMQSRALIAEQRANELEQIETERMRKNPTETFQSASKLSPIDTLAAVKHGNEGYEVEFPAKELVTLRMDVNAAKPFWNEAKDAKKIMYLFITGNQVTGWESDYMREKKKRGG